MKYTYKQLDEQYEALQGVVIEKVFIKNRHRSMAKRECKYCQKQFFVYPSTLKWNKACYCTKVCADKDKIGTRCSPDTEIKKGVVGEKALNWKGGRGMREGYMLIKVHDHPLATKSGYMREHRLVMEKQLGRYLIKEESVHHINGVKDDNRIENLKLFANESEHQKYHYTCKHQGKAG